jgi:hypothetical protein
MVQVKAAGPDTIDARSNEDSSGLIAGAIVGCLALVAALGAGGFYWYQKKTPPPPASVQVVLYTTEGESTTPLAKSTTPLATKIVELVRTPLGLGLSLDSKYKVVAIAHGSQAQRSGSFAVHDQLVSLNGQPLNGSVSFEEQLGVIAMGTKIIIEISSSTAAIEQEVHADLSQQGSSEVKGMLPDTKSSQGKELDYSSRPGALARPTEEKVVSSPASNNDAARGAVTPTEQKGEAAQTVLPSAISQPVVAAASGDKTLIAVLASCGLEHRAKLFEDENYTLEVAFRALDSGESMLMSDLRDLTLTLGECRKLITKLKHAKRSSLPNVWF